MTERADLVIMSMTPDDHATADELRQMLQFFDADTELVHLELNLDSGFVDAIAEGFITAKKYKLLECRVEMESLAEELFDSSNAEDCISGEATVNGVYIRYVLLRQTEESYMRKRAFRHSTHR